MSAHVQLSMIEAPDSEAAWAVGKAWANAAGLRVATRGRVRRWEHVSEFSDGRVLWDVEVIVRDPKGWKRTEAPA